MTQCNLTNPDESLSKQLANFLKEGKQFLDSYRESIESQQRDLLNAQRDNNKIIKQMGEEIGRLAVVSKQLSTVTRLNLSAEEQRASEIAATHSPQIRIRTSTPARELPHTITSQADNESFLHKDYANLSQSVVRLNNTIQDNFVPKIPIERKYRLTKKSDFDLWYDDLKSELTLYDLQDYLIKRVPQNVDNIDKVVKQRNEVRRLIISRVEEYYYKKFLNLLDPVDIIEKIREIRKLDMNQTSVSVRAKIYSIERDPKENILAFRERFEDIIKNFETCSSEERIPELEQNKAFQLAINKTSPELRTYIINRRQEGKPKLTIEEMTNYLLQHEAEKNAAASFRSPRAQQIREHKRPDNRNNQKEQKR